jgi:ABC-type multidrug transport system ATPase subunit
MIVGPTRAMFMDEISTGLDSSTTFQIVKSLRQFAHVMSGTVMMSLLQPAPETFDLFDDIILLSEGQIVYHGPREHVLEFFAFCGFKCPERKGVADFLQEVLGLIFSKISYSHSLCRCISVIKASESKISRGSIFYCIRAYLSFSQHKSLKIICSPEVFLI